MAVLKKLQSIFAPQQDLLRQQRELEQLRAEVAKLRIQNDSMREGMRRCVTCDYRIDFKQRQDMLTATDEPPAESTSITEN